MVEYAIEFINVHKKFRLGLVNSRSLKEIVVKLLKGKKRSELELQYKTVVNNFNYKVKKGATVSIIGHNGVGKSTLLKMVAKVTEPNSGHITINGRVAALLEIGTGFHPELTGRENVYLYGSILGFKKKELNKIFDSILDFAEIKEYIDEPVKNFSSGMYMRLAFAVAIHVNPDIIVIDEVLAVGDEQFQAKCFAKLHEFKNAGITILFVSHDMEAVKRLSDEVLYIVDEDTYFSGKPEEMISKYLTDVG